MMNLIALSLIATSFVVSGLFSPNPQNNEQVIVKGGHRAVVVEYADDIGDGNTKVSISPEDGPNKGPIHDHLSRASASVAGVAQDVKGKAQEVKGKAHEVKDKAQEEVKGMAQDVRGKAQEVKEKAQEVVMGRSGPEGVRPRELICDAYGKCKHKIAGVWGKAKEAEEAVVDTAKEIASKVGHKAEEGVEGVRQSTKDKAREKVEKVKGKTEEMVEESEEMIKEKGKKGAKELNDIAKRGKEVVFDAIWYVSAIGYVVGREVVSSIVSVTQLLGFATAYGIGIWVTFIMSHVLAGLLPRQQFGMVQSKIYPVYFKAMVGSIGLALVGHVMGHGGKMVRSKSDVLQGYNLLSCLLFVLGNLLFLEPRATKVMFNRMKLEKEEGRGRDHISPPTRVIDTVVDDSVSHTPPASTPTLTPTPNTTTTTTTTATEQTTTTSAGKQDENEAKAKLAKMDNRLKKLNSYSSLLNIMTLMGLTWHLVYLSQRLRANC